MFFYGRSLIIFVGDCENKITALEKIPNGKGGLRVTSLCPILKNIFEVTILNIST